MPLYEYQCDVCGHRFEVIHQKFSDVPVDGCPTCGGTVTRLISSPAIQFKGSGWYVTDYARSGKTDGGSGGSGKTESSSPSGPSESKSDTKSESKGDTKSESKSDTKSESKSESTSATSTKSEG